MPDPVQVGSLVVHRHDMAWVDRDNGWRIIDQFANRGIRALLHDWIAARFPFVVRRQSECGARAPDVLALGLALPPLAGKQRIALEVPANAIARIAPAPALEVVSERITAHSRAPLLLLQELAMQSRVEFRVFGSAAWEALTGLAYLSNQSDLDLLWHPQDATQLARSLEILERWQRATGIHADGEIIFPEHEAVAWREWSYRRDTASVLVKRLNGVALRTRADLLHRLHAMAATSTEAQMRSMVEVSA